MAPLDDHGVGRRDAFTPLCRCGRDAHARRVEQVPQRDRHAVNRQLCYRLGPEGFRFRERPLSENHDDRVQPRVEPIEALETRLGQFDRCELSLLQ
jgi:hypothetical protein